MSVLGFGTEGNIMLDTVVLLEYLPSKKRTWLAAWWGVGQTIAGLTSWPLLSTGSLNCDPFTEACTYSNNKGLGAVMYTCSGLILVLGVLRVTLIRLHETPKYLLSAGEDEQMVRALLHLAKMYERPCNLTLEQLASCGEVHSTHASSNFSFKEISIHLNRLFASKRLGISTSLLWLSWALIGVACPLLFLFLSSYLSSRGATFGDGSVYETWRNYALVNFSGMFGPVLAGFMVETKLFGRKYTMVVGGIVSMAFVFGYTQIKNQDSNIALNCVLAFTINIYYGTLYAYTPEFLPSAHRTTGNGIGVPYNPLMGIICALVATVADTSSSVPIFLSAALNFVLALIAALFPYEPCSQ